MTLAQAIRLIESCMEQMNARYGGTLFDEWLIVEMGETDKILAHSGPRGEKIVEDFTSDAQKLRELLAEEEHFPGDFAFTHEGHGTHFDAFVVLGKDLYLFCNKTSESTSHITKNPRWKVAQVEFAALTDAVRSDPVQK